MFCCQLLHANPSGAALLAERRGAALRMAEAFVVENGYARGLTFEGEAPPPLA